ncbi:hypothetical protein KI387_012112, partial [Taxus chinensis]
MAARNECTWRAISAEQNEYIWTAISAEYTQKSRVEEALNPFWQQQRADSVANNFIFATIVHVRPEIAESKEGKRFHASNGKRVSVHFGNAEGFRRASEEEGAFSF